MRRRELIAGLAGGGCVTDSGGRASPVQAQKREA
jgi:hypothetical protein